MEIVNTEWMGRYEDEDEKAERKAEKLRIYDGQVYHHILIK